MFKVVIEENNTQKTAALFKAGIGKKQKKKQQHLFKVDIEKNSDEKHHLFKLLEEATNACLYTCICILIGENADLSGAGILLQFLQWLSEHKKHRGPRHSFLLALNSLFEFYRHLQKLTVLHVLVHSVSLYILSFKRKLTVLVHFCQFLSIVL